MIRKETDTAAAECCSHEGCRFANLPLENRIREYADLGAVPHCCFADLLREQVIAGLQPEKDGAAGFYATIDAFNEKHPDATGHCHGSLAWLAEMYVKNSAIRLHATGGISVELSAPEAAKLLIQAGKFLDEEDCHVEDIAIADGEQMCFSTPEPELPAGFIEYLETVFQPLEEVAAVYVFMAGQADRKTGNLTIGILPASRISSHEASRLSCLIVEGVERFLDSHDQLDFLLIEDTELAEIARSVSPVIRLER